MFGPYLTEYEYDNLLTPVERNKLAKVIRQPKFDQKSNQYRRMYGHVRNGDLNDPIVRSITGYGSPYRTRPNLLPVIPVKTQ